MRRRGADTVRVTDGERRVVVMGADHRPVAHTCDHFTSYHRRVSVDALVITPREANGGSIMKAVSRRHFLSGSVGLTAAALAAAELKLNQALAQRPPGAGGPPPGVGGPPAGIAAPPMAGGPAKPLGPPPKWEFGPFEDLRDWIAELDRRGLALRVRDVDQDAYEGTALMYRLIDRFGMYFAPVLILENVKIDGKWHAGPIITNHFGHWDTECLSFGIEPIAGDHVATYYKALARVQEYLDRGSAGAFPTAPFIEVTRDQAPCKEVVLRDDQVNLLDFAFIQSNPADSTRYVNTGSVFTDDAELGKNFGTYRCEIKGPRLLGINPEEGQGAWRAFMKAKERGDKSVKVSIALGQDPVTWVVSSSKLNRAGADELEVVSAIRGKPLRVIRSETNDHLIPANSEMVIEGIVPLDQPMLPEGPFGEMYGYMGARKSENFWMQVTAITHRRNPWVVNQFTGVSHGFTTAPLEQIAMNSLKRFMPNVTMLHTPVEATGFCFVSIKKQKPGEALEIGQRIAQIVGIAKVVVVVDDDIEVLDRTQVMHAMGSRWQPNPASRIIDESRGMPLDPSLTNRPMTSKIVIDATRQWPEEGGPAVYQALNRTELERLAPDAFARVGERWTDWVGDYRPPGV
jgi:4-hydroxy-3-polyprenylbenzoate decarboxylase